MMFKNVSKKLSAYVISVSVLILCEVLTISEDARQQIIELTMMYIGGQSAVDITLALKGAKRA